MKDSYSYQELKDAELANISIFIQRATLSEFINLKYSHEEPIDISIVLYGNVTGFTKCNELEEEVVAPINPVKISILRKTTDDLLKNESKYPLGFFIFSKNETYFRICCRTELVERLASAIPTATDGTISFSFEVPYLEGYETEVYYPILAYGAVLSNGNQCA